MKKRIFSLALVLMMVLACTVPAMAVENTGNITATYDQKAKAVTVTVDGVSEVYANVPNNKAMTVTLNGWEVTFTAKGNTVALNSVKKIEVVNNDTPADPGLAATDPDDLSAVEGFAFHCNTFGGNGRAYIVGKDKKFGHKVWLDLQRSKDDAKIWYPLFETAMVCATCGSAEWITFSNKSGVPNGKNIQLTHVPTAPPKPLGMITIQKSVGDVSFYEWGYAQGLSDDKIQEILSGMKFVAYRLDGEKGNRVGPAIEGEMILLSGAISFKDLPVGWYEVVETVSGTARSYFADSDGVSSFYRVSGTGLTGPTSAMTNFISGQDGVGTVVNCDATCPGGQKDHVLPNVWNGQLANDPNFKKLMDMKAQWIWDRECTHVYGKTGSVYEDSFIFNAANGGSTKLYLAADNAAVVYLNGKLVGYTKTAFEQSGSGLSPAELLADFDRTALTASVFNGGWADGWCYAYDIEINFVEGTNVLTIIALNSVGTENTGTANDNYNEKTNPCGLIFGFEVPAVTFNNTLDMKK